MADGAMVVVVVVGGVWVALSLFVVLIKSWTSLQCCRPSTNPKANDRLAPAGSAGTDGGYGTVAGSDVGVGAGAASSNSSVGTGIDVGKVEGDGPGVPVADSGAPSHSESAGAAVQVGKVRVLTWNVYLRPWPIAEAHGDIKAERLQAIVRHVLPEYDLLCFQEAFSSVSNWGLKIVEAGKQAGLAHHAWPAGPQVCSRQLIGSGLLILSRLPILSSAFERYPPGIHSDTLAGKGVLYARVQREQRRAGAATQPRCLHVFTTHLQACYGEDGMVNVERVQKGQLRQLMGFIEQTLAKWFREGDDVLLCGDFNIHAGTPRSYSLLNEYVVQAGFQDLLGPPELHPVTQWSNVDEQNNEVGTHTLSPKEMAAKRLRRVGTALDYLFYKAGAATSRMPVSTEDVTLEAFPKAEVMPFEADNVMGSLSDHAGVRADLPG